MDSINRLLVSLAAMVVIALFVVTILVATGALDYRFLPWGLAGAEGYGDYGALLGVIESESYNAWFESELRGLALLGQPWKAISIAAALVGIGLMLLFLAFQVRGGGRRRETPLLISSTDLGLLSVDPASIRTLVEHTGTANRSVVDLRCRLSVRRKTPPGGPDRITISCQPRLEMGADLREVRDDVQSRVKEMVERLTGLEVDRVHITRVRYERLPDHRLIE